MPRKFICLLTDEQLDYYYNQQKMTIKELCSVAGCKSDITMTKILHERGFDTNSNQKRAKETRQGKTEKEFENWLKTEYLINKRSMTSIAKELDVTWTIVSRYLDKYNIPKRTKSEQQSGSGSTTWKGGKRKKTSGYIEIYCPTHPKANKRKCVYEHVLVAEKMIGRYLTDDEVVHHINRNKSDNRPENLMVLTKSEHSKLHHQAKEFGNFKNKGVVIA